MQQQQQQQPHAESSGEYRPSHHSGGQRPNAMGNQQYTGTAYPKITTLQDLNKLPRLSPEQLHDILNAQSLRLAPDGTLMRKHVYRLNRHKGGQCGGCNRCCGGCCDEDRCCGCCNDAGCCDRKRITFRRCSGGSDASVWSTATAIKPKKGCC